MKKQAPVLTASTRDRLGTRYTKRVRDGGGLPAVVYGHQKDPEAIALPAKETIGHIEAGEKVFNLRVGDRGAETVLLRDIQFDYLGTRIIHADFARVDLTERVHTRVAVHLIGEAIGLKSVGAVLLHPTNELDIECTVDMLPDHLDVNIAGLDVGQSITAGQVPMPDPSIRLRTDPNAVVARIVVQLETVEPTAEAAAVDTAAAAGPEVISEKKKEERAEAKAEKDAPAGKKEEPKKK